VDPTGARWLWNLNAHAAEEDDVVLVTAVANLEDGVTLLMGLEAHHFAQGPLLKFVQRLQELDLSCGTFQEVHNGLDLFLCPGIWSQRASILDELLTFSHLFTGGTSWPVAAAKR